MSSYRGRTGDRKRSRTSDRPCPGPLLDRRGMRFGSRSGWSRDRWRASVRREQFEHPGDREGDGGHVHAASGRGHMLLEGTQGAQSGAVDERDLRKIQQDRAAPRVGQCPQPHQQFVGSGKVDLTAHGDRVNVLITPGEKYVHDNLTLAGKQQGCVAASSRIKRTAYRYTSYAGKARRRGPERQGLP